MLIFMIFLNMNIYLMPDDEKENLYLSCFVALFLCKCNMSWG